MHRVKREFVERTGAGEPEVLTWKGSPMNVAGRLGVALVVLMAIYMAFNTFQAWGAPVAFADRLGLPITGAESEGWVRVYALRAAFIALLLGGLVLARQWRALSLFAFAALIMPLGDAWLTYNTGAPIAIFGRHIALIGVIALAAFLLSQAAKSRVE
jgi:hypothetical protein